MTSSRWAWARVALAVVALAGVAWLALEVSAVSEPHEASASTESVPELPFHKTTTEVYANGDTVTCTTYVGTYVVYSGTGDTITVEYTVCTAVPGGTYSSWDIWP